MAPKQITPTRPLEYVCFFPVEFPTKEGTAYVFLAVDAFSKFAINTGSELNDKPETIIKHIYLYRYFTSIYGHNVKAPIKHEFDLN